MEPEAVFNRYDVRGDYPREIDEEFSRRMGRAVGTYESRSGRGKAVVGRDSRNSSEKILPEFVAGARESGASVVDIGEGTADRVALAASHYGGTGVMITASHHPWERTGFKLLYEEGNGFSNQDLERVKDLFREQDFESGDGTLLNEEHEFDEIYVERLVEAFQELVAGDMDVSVLVDGPDSAALVAAEVFGELGADVALHEREKTPEPEPGADNRADIIEDVTGHDVAVGYDPDGDRVYLVHPDLGWVDGDRIFYALTEIIEPDTLVASIDTSPMIEESSADVYYSRVGDVFVSEKGIDVGADLLGEPNGHYAVTDFSWYSSGVLASLVLASKAEQLPEILEPVRGYTSVRITQDYGSSEERDGAFQAVKKKVAGDYEVVSRLDGVKFLGEGFTGLVRPSGTSPKLRLVIHSTGYADPQEVAGDLL